MVYKSAYVCKLCSKRVRINFLYGLQGYMIHE